MLSAETAVGAYSVDVIQTMDRIIISVENDSFYRKLVDAARTKARDTPSDAITAAAREVAEIATISAICTITKSGATAMRCARERPCVPIMVLTSLTKTARRLCLFWGLQCIVTHKASQFKDAVREVNSCAKSHNFSENGDKIIVTAGIPFDTPGTTNILRILTVSDYIDDSEFLP
jgi:pyruvate kinase